MYRYEAAAAATASAVRALEPELSSVWFFSAFSSCPWSSSRVGNL